MSMNKMFKKVLAVVAAGAMTMGMAMPTFAADPGKTTEAWITKTYNTEAGKAEKFSFTAEQVKTGTGIITTDAAVTMPEISFTDTETGKTSRRGKITFPTYPDAGKYEYTVKEIQTADPAVVNGDHEKMIMSQAEYKMDVYVSNINNKYEIIAGERRYKASALAGMTKIPAIINNLDDKEAAKVALLENLQRKNLNPIDEARTYQKILELDQMTQETLAKTMGKSQSAVANKLRLLALPDEIQRALLKENISERHARTL